MRGIDCFKQLAAAKKKADETQERLVRDDGSNPPNSSFATD